MCHKAVETVCNINKAFIPGTASKRTMQWCLEDKEHTGQPSEVDNDQLRATIEADPLKTTQEVAEELNVDHSVVVWHWKQIGKVKKLDKKVHHELTANKKKIVLKCCPLILCNSNEPFLNRIVTCDEKWILFDNRQ
ncbi:hypothetical protein FD755_019908 [Muntiacus reevesi]|uniref:Mos1 transposase HTH domain-containing protein n=1 Tax=Muntiacus reevesi TaxID=9886 RepID=A0A5N3X5D8_MUNRE|nr:hypothetical protein FD755_019908 [Muntiacus reevesi]